MPGSNVPPPDDGLCSARRAAALLDRYEQIAQASHEMLAAARHGDWAAVTRLEDSCRALIAELQVRAAQQGLNPAEQRRRVALLRAILADDAEIRERSEPWLLELEKLLQPSGAAARRTAGD
jgi:flagellar protein FliT